MDVIDILMAKMLSGGVDPEQISSAVTDWLGDNVDPVGSAVVVDSSLSIEGAAADAKATGDALSRKITRPDGGQSGQPLVSDGNGGTTDPADVAVSPTSVTLDGTTDTTSEIQVGTHGLTRLTHLALMRHHAIVDHSTRRSNLPTKHVGKSLHPDVDGVFGIGD